MIPTPRLREILEAAEKATPGPWGIDPYSDDETIAIYSPETDRHVAILQDRDEFNEFWEPDAEYIAKADPTTIAAVIKELIAVREAADRLREQAMRENNL